MAEIATAFSHPLQMKNDIIPHLAPTQVHSSTNPGGLASYPATCLGPAKACGSCSHVGDPKENLGSWLWISVTPGIAAVWGVSH